MADLVGRPVLDHAASNVPADPALHKFAVIPSGADDRRKVLAQNGWQVLENEHADLGQSTSLKVGIDFISADAAVDQVIVLLGDMPFVQAAHIEALRLSADVPSTTCVMSERDGVLLPPALFKRCHFEALAKLEGDRGAKALFSAIAHGNMTVPIATEHAADIDSAADLDLAKETVNA